MVSITMKQAVIRTAVIAAALTFAVALFGGTYLYARFTPAAHIILDTDTAVELTVNRFGRVILHRSYHSGKANALTMLGLTELPLSDAVEQVVDAAYAAQSFDVDAPVGVFVCVHAASDLHAGRLSRELTDAVETQLRKQGISCGVCGGVCPDAMLAAGHNKDVSPGLLCMIASLSRSDNDPVDAVYKRMLKYTPRQIKARYGQSMGIQKEEVCAAYLFFLFSAVIIKLASWTFGPVEIVGMTALGTGPLGHGFRSFLPLRDVKFQLAAIAANIDIRLQSTRDQIRPVSEHPAGLTELDLFPLHMCHFPAAAQTIHLSHPNFSFTVYRYRRKSVVSSR